MKSFAQTENWSNTAGASITVGTTFKTGIPFIVSGEISTSVTAAFDHTWGKTTYEELTYSTFVNCPAPPGIKVTCKYLTKTAQLDVPYTMYLSRSGGVTKTATGIWTGVQTFNDHIEFIEE